MLISEAVNDLQNVTKKKITYDNIAEALGLSKQAIGSRAARKQHLKPYELEILKDFFIKNTDNNKPAVHTVSSSCGASSSENITADYYSSFTVKSGTLGYEISGEKTPVIISKKLIDLYSSNRSYIVIDAFGRSMEPEIKDGDKLIIEKHIENDSVKDNRIYIFLYKNDLFCSRLIKNIDEYTVVFDNPDKDIYPVRHISCRQLKDFNLIGRIAGSVRKIN